MLGFLAIVHVLFFKKNIWIQKVKWYIFYGNEEYHPEKGLIFAWLLFKNSTTETDFKTSEEINVYWFLKIKI